MREVPLWSHLRLFNKPDNQHEIVALQRGGAFSHPTLLRTSDLVRTSIYDECSGSTKIPTHLDHISHCETAPGTNWSNICTYRVFIIILAAIRSTLKFEWEKH